MTTFTAPLAVTLNLTPDSEDKPPAWPANLPEPVVTFTYPLNSVETSVDIDGDTVMFWRWGGSNDNVSNSADEGVYFRASDRPLASLHPSDREAVLNWGTVVHRRAEHALATQGKTLTAESAAAILTPGSETCEALIAFATNTTVPADERTPKEMALFRGAEALAVTGQITGSAQEDLQLLMVDLLHRSEEDGLDLHEALRNANRIFQLERNDAAFTNGF